MITKPKKKGHTPFDLQSIEDDEKLYKEKILDLKKAF